MKSLDPVSNRRELALHLVVFALRERKIQSMAADLRTCRGSDRFRIVLQNHPFQQPRDLLRNHNMLRCHLVDLGYMLFRRTHAVDELPIITQQKKSSRILIQPTHSLYALHSAFSGTLAQWCRTTPAQVRGLARATSCSALTALFVEAACIATERELVAAHPALVAA